MVVTKLNESFYQLAGTPEQIQAIKRKFTVKVAGAFFDPMVKRGFKSDSEVFYIETPDGSIIIPSGLMPFVAGFTGALPNNPEFTEQEILDHIKSLNLPFEPYDYQISSSVESLIKKQQLCLAATGAGKSVIIYIIVSFLMSKSRKGLILVPNISLTSQLRGDFKEYGASDEFLDKIRLIGGDNNEKELDKQLTITTWQSGMRIETGFDSLNFIIIDEAHGLKFENKSTDIVYNAINAPYRIGLTGTLPDDQVAKMSVLSCVGAPRRYIKTQGLIERGLATPVQINVIKLRYNAQDKSLFTYVGNYAKKLKFVKEHVNRNDFIARLSLKTAAIGNTVIMCSHTEHMKDIFKQIMKNKFPDVEVLDKNIVGKKAFDFQEQYGVFYIAGATKAKDRDKIIAILKGHSDAILVSNFQLFSTGINAKGISNIIFASPLKSYTTITQSIGRAIRTHVSKKVATIYDLVDDFSTRGNSGPFYKQYQERLLKSYNSEGFPINERIINI